MGEQASPRASQPSPSKVWDGSGDRKGARPGNLHSQSGSRFHTFGNPTDTSRNTLFSGGRTGAPHQKRASAVVFRRPTSSRAPAHQRPIFMVGENGTDPRMCVDVHNPRRFGSMERTCAEKAMLQGTQSGRSFMGQTPFGSRPSSVGSAGYSKAPSVASSASSRPVSALDFAPEPAFRPTSGAL